MSNPNDPNRANANKGKSSEGLNDMITAVLNERLSTNTANPGVGDSSFSASQPPAQQLIAPSSSPQPSAVGVSGSGLSAASLIPPATTRLVCPNCNHLVPLAQPADDRWYAVWVGRLVGWVRGSDRANQLTRGVSGQAMQYCHTEAEARSLFLQKQGTGLVRNLPDDYAVNFTMGPADGYLT
ncbi:hypothetical protein AAF712_003197 [Marasmius tenuissimus]|uniref:Uncharacterized protein n=1 Tax=Marasmius tenuissimus TaxID=585030 RepID=A0ABR3A873_9AGAR